MPVRGGPVHDAAAEAAGAVHMPLLRVSPAVELRLRDLGHIPALRAAEYRAAVLLHVSPRSRDPRVGVGRGAGGPGVCAVCVVVSLRCLIQID